MSLNASLSLARLTDAVLSVLARDEALVADAVVAGVGVDALAVLADALLLALVRFPAFVRLFVALLAWRALASERADRIYALASFAQRRDCLAFVDICWPSHH